MQYINVVVMLLGLDDRTFDEREFGFTPVSDHWHVATSRCDSVDAYTTGANAKYNDIAIPYNIDAYNQLLKGTYYVLLIINMFTIHNMAHLQCTGDVPESVAHEIAHLFIREPLQVYKECLNEDDRMTDEQFEVSKIQQQMHA